MPPHSPVSAEHEQRKQLDGQDNRERLQKELIVARQKSAFESQPIRRVISERNQTAVEQHFGDTPLVHEVADERRDRFAAARIDRGFVVDMNAREIDGKNRERQDEGESGNQTPARIAPLQRQRNSGAAGGERPQYADRSRLRQSDRD